MALPLNVILVAFCCWLLVFFWNATVSKTAIPASRISQVCDRDDGQGQPRDKLVVPVAGRLWGEQQHGGCPGGSSFGDLCDYSYVNLGGRLPHLLVLHHLLSHHRWLWQRCRQHKAGKAFLCSCHVCRRWTLTLPFVLKPPPHPALMHATIFGNVVSIVGRMYGRRAEYDKKVQSHRIYYFSSFQFKYHKGPGLGILCEASQTAKGCASKVKLLFLWDCDIPTFSSRMVDHLQTKWFFNRGLDNKVGLGGGGGW